MSFDEMPLCVAAARDSALAQVAANAGPNFIADAMRFVVDYLRNHGEMSGEDITDACKAAGIVPPNDDRAFGAVYMNLVRDELIEQSGTCKRRKGHASDGGKLWRIRK